MDVWVSFLCICLVWCLFEALSFIRKKSKTTLSNLPPGPPPLPVVGNLLSLGSQPHRSLARLSHTYGPIIKLQLGHVTTIVVSSPPIAREILQTHDAIFSDRTIPDSVTALRQNELGLPWIPVSPLWRNLRKICNLHIFSHKKLEANQHIRQEKVQELLSYINRSLSKGDAVDIGEVAFKAVVNLLSKTMLSEDLANPSGSAKDFKDLVWRIMVEAGKPNIADYFPALKKIDLQGSRRRMTVYFTKIFELFDSLIEKRLRERAAVGSIRKNDVLDTLLDAREDKSEEVDIFLIKHFLLDLFVAGTDTTSSTVEWALSELIHSPEKLSRAQAELDRVIGKGKPIEESEIARLPYLQAVIKETFRLHPPVPLYLPRKSGSEIGIAGFTIPKDAQVFVNVWAIGRDPSIWKDPEVFMPERFLGSEIDVKGQDFELAPFGAGRRICPGLPLALRMLHWMLGSLINSFNWELEGKVKPEDLSMEEKFGITLQRAQPLRVIPKPL